MFRKYFEEMRQFKNLLSVVWEVIFIIQFIGWLLLFYFPLLILFTREAWWPASMKIQRFWAGWLRVTMGICTHIDYEIPLEKDQPYIYVANHSSFLDILVAYKYIPGYFHFMAKGSLARVPLFRIMFWRTHIPFERGKVLESSRAYQRAVNDLAKGYSVLIYPEGTQNNKRYTLLPFRTGAFRMSVETGTPIVPVTCLNNLDILPHQSDLFRPHPGGPGHLYIKVGKPIYPHEYYHDMVKLKEKVFTIVMQNLSDYAAHQSKYRGKIG